MKSLTLAFTTALAAWAVPSGISHAQPSGSTFTPNVLPANTSFAAGKGSFAQSFVVTSGGLLTSLAIYGDWAPAHEQIGYRWWLSRDTPTAVPLAAGDFTVSANDNAISGQYEISFDDMGYVLPVNAQDVLVFALVRQADSQTKWQPSSVPVYWWIGNFPDVLDSYPYGQGYALDDSGSWSLAKDLSRFENKDLDFRLEWEVSSTPIPCTSSGGIVFHPAMQTVYEVPVGTTELTIDIVWDGDGDMAQSVTVGGQPATFTGPHHAQATLTLSGNDTITLDVVVKDVCDHQATKTITIHFIDLCPQEVFDVCTEPALGTVFYLDLVSPSGQACTIRCATDASAANLSCDSATLLCPP